MFLKVVIYWNVAFTHLNTQNDITELNKNMSFAWECAFNSSSNFDSTMKILTDKAQKAMFRLNGITLTVNVLNYLTLWLYISYHMVVKYGVHIKKVALRFYKLILGVNKKATNLAVRGELWRYPIEIDMLHRSIIYFFQNLYFWRF